MVQTPPNDIRNDMRLISPISFANDSCYFIPGFGNSCVFETNQGLVIFDFPIIQLARRTFEGVRGFTNKPLKYIIFSHGHFDHAFGHLPFLEEINEKGWEKPEVIAHENCIRRFKKYQMLKEYHDWINGMQFASLRGRSEGAVTSPREALQPTIIIKGNEGFYDFKLGDISFEIYHNKGETDDSIWLWVPEKKTICAGDLIISSFPNVGNPYKVQRYPKDWAIANEKMMEKKAEYLVPGHGRMIKGKNEVKEVLLITAEAMHFVHDEVVKRLNEGKYFEQIFHEMVEIFPAKLKKNPYLREMYGCYRFAIHAAYRLYHGWYNSGNPTDLFPSKSNDIAREFLRINTEKRYLEHAKSLYNQDKLQLALHVVDVIIKGNEDESSIAFLEALKLKIKILKQQSKEESSFIVSNIINNAILELKEKLRKWKNP
ncbi:MAG: alkyl sulfatase dimerization domain-containing protein [Promethearchaeota archaeon]